MSETTTIKFVKIKNAEGYGDAIPIGVDAINVDIDGKGNLQDFIENILLQTLSHDIAPEYDGSSTYQVGAYVLYENQLYRCITAITTADGVFNSEKWTPVDIGTEIVNHRAMIASKFSTSTSYAAGAYVTYGAKLYKFTAAHPAGVWTGSDVSEISVQQQVTSLITRTNSLESWKDGLIDNTLTTTGKAADAKKVGNEIQDLKDDLSEIEKNLSVITDGDFDNYTPVTMNGWYYVDSIGRIDIHETRGARTYLIDVSDQPESIHINVIGDANRCRILLTETEIDSVTRLTTGTYVDKGDLRSFTLTKADYVAYKTIAVNTDYNRATDYTNYATLNVIRIYKNLVETINNINDDIELIIGGGTTPQNVQAMNGWYYVDSIGRIDIHETRGARTYLIDVSSQPDSIQLKLSSTANRCRLLFMTASIDSVGVNTYGTYLDEGNSTKSVTLTKSDISGYRTLAVTTDYNRATDYTDWATVDATFTSQITAIDSKARADIAEMKQNASGYRNFVLTDSVSTLTNDSIILCSNVDNKKNATYEFWGEAGSGFTSVSVGHGYNVSYSGYAKVDSTKLYWYTSSGTLQKSVNHELSLNGFIHISIEQDNNAKAVVRVIDRSGEASLTECTFAGSRGDVFATVSGTMNNVVLSAAFRDLTSDVWFFGDSYISMGENMRWPYYAVAAGYTKFYMNGFGGANSSHAILSFRETLEIATPHIIIWGIGMNGSDTSSAINSTYKSVLDEVMETCEAKGIELILCTIPNTPDRNHTFKNAYVKASGYRYVDFAKAVGAESAGSTWYDGMLEGSNSESEEQLNERIHPTALGAKVLYHRLITDVPEMLN